MNASETDVINQQFREVLEAMDAAKAKRQENFEQAFNSKNLDLARRLVAVEIAAEKRLEQVMNKFGDQADTWGNRAYRARKETHSPDIESAFNRSQTYAEAELACREVLQESETNLARLRLLELEAMMASHSDLQKLFRTWSDTAERAREAGAGDYEKFARNCKLICQSALDASKLDI